VDENSLSNQKLRGRYDESQNRPQQLSALKEDDELNSDLCTEIADATFPLGRN